MEAGARGRGISVRQADGSTLVIVLRGRAALFLSIMSVAWCALIGGWIWFTPIWSTAFINDTSTVRYQAFSDVSLFGPAPLIVPVLITTLATWAARRRRRLVLGSCAFLLTVFAFISGFSIGAGYVPASALLVAAVLML